MVGALKIIDFETRNIIFRAKHCKNIISVPMSYINFLYVDTNWYLSLFLHCYKLISQNLMIILLASLFPKTSAVLIKYCGCCKRGCKYKAACKFSKKMSQEALNRVLTLPDYRTRCTDHFAGSGSKIENKNISVVRKQWTYRICVPMLCIMRISNHTLSKV